MKSAEQTEQGIVKDEIIEGLNRTPKTLPSKYFYDKRGSELFEEICTLEEYYLTEAEISIMKNHIHEITDEMGTGLELIEFGSGSSLKTRLLLDHLQEVKAYVPIDISEDFLAKEAEKLEREYPDLKILPLALDYSMPFELPDEMQPYKKVIYFPGSTIGNFVPAAAKNFLKKCSKLAGSNGGLLIGVDTKKDPKVLEAAYNDSKGITAAFNKNILVRLNRELDATFNPDWFEHRATYNHREGRIEMHLVSLEQQDVTVAGTSFNFDKGEEILTELSYKYSPEEFEKMASDFFELKIKWTGKDNLFGIYYLLAKD
ncbi:MAG: L-histidine N(alpha)-methyltransferase [Balneolaceae bacterium]